MFTCPDEAHIQYVPRDCTIPDGWPPRVTIPIVDLGDGPWSGAYVLRIAVAQIAAVVFGRFAGGAAVVVAPGDYLYIGSARSHRDEYFLARRVLRHLTRTGGRPPHALRQTLLAHLQAHGWPAARVPDNKTLRWHVDFLLDHPDAEVTQVLVFRDAHVNEHQLVARLMGTSGTAPLAPGLGAGDHPGHTHLLRWTADVAQWDQFVRDLTV